jgi:hypothetical protein
MPFRPSPIFLTSYAMSPTVMNPTGLRADVPWSSKAGFLKFLADQASLPVGPLGKLRDVPWSSIDSLLLADADVAIAVAKVNPWMLKHCQGAWTGSILVAMEAVQVDGRSLQLFDASIRDDADVFFVAAIAHNEAISHGSPRLRSDPALALEVGRRDPRAVSRFSTTVMQHPDVAELVLVAFPAQLRQLSDKQRADRRLVGAAAKRWPEALTIMDRDLWSDLDFMAKNFPLDPIVAGRVLQALVDLEGAPGALKRLTTNADVLNRVVLPVFESPTAPRDVAVVGDVRSVLDEARADVRRLRMCPG